MAQVFRLDTGDIAHVADARDVTRRHADAPNVRFDAEPPQAGAQARDRANPFGRAERQQHESRALAGGVDHDRGVLGQMDVAPHQVGDDAALDDHPLGQHEEQIDDWHLRERIVVVHDLHVLDSRAPNQPLRARGQIEAGEADGRRVANDECGNASHCFSAIVEC